MPNLAKGQRPPSRGPRRWIDADLLLRALRFFDDADREATLPGEGPKDWETVKDYLRRQVGDLIVPPTKHLAIARRKVPGR